jgi:molecular chaperone GrpE (heat shock protein)
MRRRLMKQIDDAKLFGIQGFCKDLLEVLYVFYEGVSLISGAGSAICTAVVVARCNGR